MRDVGAVESFALLDKGLRPDHLLAWAQPDRDIEHRVPLGVQEPLVVDGRQAVARAVDDVDEELAAVRLAKPVRKGHVCFIARPGEGHESLLEVRASDEEVQVLGMPLDTRVARKGIRAANEHFDPGLLKRCECAAVKLPLLGGQEVFFRRGDLSHDSTGFRKWGA